VSWFKTNRRLREERDMWELNAGLYHDLWQEAERDLVERGLDHDDNSTND
jgi:hypothetical protein